MLLHHIIEFLGGGEGGVYSGNVFKVEEGCFCDVVDVVFKREEKLGVSPTNQLK